MGVNLAMSDDQAEGSDSGRDRKRAEVYGAWLQAASKSDFVGVQCYTRARVGKDKDLPGEGRRTDPDGLRVLARSPRRGHSLRAAQARVPVYVTENGIGTEDDARRIAYIERALAGVRKCLADNIDVRGYIHWSLMDNFEWMMGYRPQVRTRRGQSRSGTDS